MVEFELVIDKEFQNLLPPLTAAEHQQLEANLVADGRVIDPVLYWCDPKMDQNVVIDGMHRWPIAKANNLPCRTEPMPFKTRNEAALWILEHQLGRRNLLKPEAIRKIRGELYNRLKGPQGGDHRSKATSQNGMLKGGAAKHVADLAGVSTGTVMRDGKYAEAMSKLSEPIRKAVETCQIKASEVEVLAMADMPKGEQQAAVRDLRVGKSPSLSEAIKAHGGKLAKQAATKPAPMPEQWAAAEAEADAADNADEAEAASEANEPEQCEPEEQAAPECDDEGTAVAMAAHNRRIDAFCEGLERWAMEHKPDVEYLDKDGRWDVFLTALHGGLLAIQEAKGKICSDCRGEGCRECLSLGYVAVGDVDEVSV
jgi:hypothetical protein